MCACILSFLFPPLSFSPSPRPPVLPQAVLRLIKVSQCPTCGCLGLSSAVSSGQTQRRAANCNFFFFSSLFLSILFQLGVDFTLLAGKRRLPSPNFFKSNLFFFYLRNSVKVMRLQILCSSAGPIHGSKSVASLCCSPKHVMLKGAESWPGYLTYIPTNLGFIWLKWPIFVILVRRTPKRCFFSHVPLKNRQTPMTEVFS